MEKRFTKAIVPGKTAVLIIQLPNSVSLSIAMVN